jgi:hypothetical protein
LSSQIVTRADLFEGPAVVTAAPHAEAQNNAGETACAIELAKYNLARGSGTTITPPGDSPPATPDGESGSTTTDKYAFAFDIDGVLIKGGEVIPAAIEAMKVLNGQNEYGIKVSAFPQIDECSKILTMPPTGLTSSSRTAEVRPRKNDASSSPINFRWTSPRASSSVVTLQ